MVVLQTPRSRCARPPASTNAALPAQSIATMASRTARYPPRAQSAAAAVGATADAAGPHDEAGNDASAALLLLTSKRPRV